MHETFDPSGPAAKGAGIFGLHCDSERAALVFLPVPFDATASYGVGASQAPAAIVAASHQVELYDRQLGRPYERGLAMLPSDPNIARLNAEARLAAARARDEANDAATRERARAEVNQATSDMNARVYATCRQLLREGRVVGTVGGDHSTPLGSILAHTEQYPDLSVLHIDAHCDLRAGYEGFVHSHASIMHNALFRSALTADGPTLTPVPNLVQVGVRDVCEEEHNLVVRHKNRIRTFFDDELAERAMAGEPFVKTAGDIVDALGANVYVSLDIDGLEPALCPHTGTPVPGGLSYRQMLALLRALTMSGRRLVGFDLNEVAPGGPSDEWDANVAARLLYKLAGHALAGGQPATNKGRIGFGG